MQIPTLMLCRSPAQTGWHTLTRLVLPFDPDNMKNGDNFTKVDADLTDIAEGLMSKVLNSYDNAVDISMNNAKTGIRQSQQFVATDLNTSEEHDRHTGDTDSWV